MAGRTRRTRLLVLLVFSVVAIVLYTRNTTPVDDYLEYYKNQVGGGAVIRPKPDDGGQVGDSPYIPPVAPIPEAVQPESPPAPAPPPEVHTTSTTKQEPAAKPTPPQKAAEADPLPPPPAPVESDDGLSYGVGEGRVEVPVVPQEQTTKVHWSQQPEHFPATSTIQLPSSETSIPFPRIQRAVKKLAEAGADKERLAIVKGVTEHTWKGYRDIALGSDEVRPLSARVNNPFNGWGATLVDSLDTLWIAGMEKEFEEAVEHVGKIDFTFSSRQDIPIFETVIRYLGGLIAAYDVSGKKHIVLLDKAVELAEVLFSIFDTPNRMPQTYYRWKPSFASQPHRAATRVILAEIGTLSLEFTRLAQLTKEPKYYDAIARITDAFEEWQSNTRLPGMWPTSFDASGCNKTATRILQLEADELAAVAAGGTTASDKSGNKLVTDPNDLKQGLQRGLEEGVASRQPDIGKVERWDDPVQKDADVKERVASRQPSIGKIEEGSLDDQASREKLTSEEPGTTKHKRDESGVRSIAEGREQRAAPEAPITPRASKLEECVPQGFDSSSVNSQETFTLSGASDSMYEYLPKEYLLLGGQVEKYRSMYLSSAETAIQQLVYKPMTKDERDILFTGELRLSPNYSQPDGQRDYVAKFKPEIAHLACFAGGMFAMGGVLFNKPEHVEIGSKLTDGCVWAYNVTATGIMPEGAEAMMCPETWGNCPWNETAYWDELDPYWETRTSRASTYQEPVLDDDIDFDSDFLPPSKPEAQPAPQPPAPSLNLNKRDAHDDGSIAKRQLVDSSLTQPPSAPQPHGDLPPLPSLPPMPVYTPAPPLSHKDYVESKISEERLPPGYTRISARGYILRPEAIESVFYMYRITGDQYWRDVGWNMFTAVDRHTHARHGNSAIDDVTKSAPEQRDQEESFWLAETLKYFYLLYDDPEKWSLDDWVLNTEAHLFRRPPYEFEQGKFS